MSLRLVNVQSSLTILPDFQPLKSHKADIPNRVAGDPSPKWTIRTTTFLEVLTEGSGAGYVCSTMLFHKSRKQLYKTKEAIELQ